MLGLNHQQGDRVLDEQFNFEKRLIMKYEKEEVKLAENEQFNYGASFGGRVVTYWNNTKYGYYVMVRRNDFYFLVRIKSELLYCDYCSYWPEYKNIINDTQHLVIEDGYFVDRPRYIYSNNRGYLCLTLGKCIDHPTKFYFLTETHLFEHTVNTSQIFHPRVVKKEN